MDVKKTFLNGEMEEDVYIEHQEGFIIHNKKISCMHIEESPIWYKTSTMCLVQENG
jgi:hypothetical protein